MAYEWHDNRPGQCGSACNIDVFHRTYRPAAAPSAPADADRAAVPDTTSRISYFIQSRPAPGQPWQNTNGVNIVTSWAIKSKALDALAYRCHMQPTWEHRLMQRTTTITEAPANEERP